MQQLRRRLFARADKSGTSTKELGIWAKTDVDPATTKPAWYLETGQGMGASLTIASEKGAYTLTDRATYLANRDQLKLEILVEGNKSLLNIYHVITVNTEKWPKANYEGALAFLKFMTDPATQEVIGKFGVDKFGQPLFVPDADKNRRRPGLIIDPMEGAACKRSRPIFVHRSERLEKTLSSFMVGGFISGVLQFTCQTKHGPAACIYNLHAGLLVCWMFSCRLSLKRQVIKFNSWRSVPGRR